MTRVVVVVVVVVLALLGCTRPVPPVPPVAPAVVAPVPVAAPVARWPMPMRVMTWTDAGLRHIGTLPDAPPATTPSTPWYVEPTRPLDPASFERIVTALREESIPGLSLRGQQGVAILLPALAAHPTLSALVLDDTDVDAAALASVTLPLRRLYLARTRLDDTAIATLAPRWPALEAIDLEGTPIGDRAAIALSALPALKAINVADTQVGDIGGVSLASAPVIEILDLGRTLVGERTAAALATTHLTQLFLDDTRAGRGIKQLAPLAPTLRRLDLSKPVGYAPTDADLAWLANATQLHELRLSNTRVTDATIKTIANLPIHELSLARTPITNAGIAILATRFLLEELDLADTKIDDAHARPLFALPALRMLRLDNTAVTDAGLAAPTANLVELYLSRTKVTDAGLAILDHTPQLTALGLGHTSIDTATLARIGTLTSLTTLVLSKTTAPPASLAVIGNLHALERLYLDDTNLDDESFATFGLLTSLTTLHVANTTITNATLPVLRNFMQLGELTIGDTRVDNAIADLSAWPRLRTLSLTFLRVGDADLATLVRATSLRALDLSGTEVTNPAPLAALPELKILGLSKTRLSAAGRAAIEPLVRRGIEIVR
jgi:Leucine-rich repeat (LRR) protein